jgi:hypothetical protein
VERNRQLDHLQRPQSVFSLQKALMEENQPPSGIGGPILGQLKGALARLTRKRTGK